MMLPYKHSQADMAKAVSTAIGIEISRIKGIDIVKKSIDARQKSSIRFVYVVDITLDKELEGSYKLPPFAEVIDKSPSYNMPVKKPKSADVVVVGSGPCGLLAAIMLLETGHKVLVVERGSSVEKRIADVRKFWVEGIFNPLSNVQFGAGGAGTFSDGKLTTQIKDKLYRSKKVLQELVQAGAPPEILYQAKPHIGTDILVRVVKNICKKITTLGGRICFDTQLTAIQTDNGSIKSVQLSTGEQVDTKYLVLAIGHSARDTFEMLYNSGVAMEAKPLSIGVRIEHPQEIVNKAQYNTAKSDPFLGAADYKLVHHCSNGRSAYTFCMCPGGEVIAAASEPDTVVTNGMSIYARSKPNANSALLIGVNPADFPSSSPLAGVELQRQCERKAFEIAGGNYFAPAQLVGDFLKGIASTKLGGVIPSYTPGVELCNIADCLPQFAVQTLREAIVAMDKKLRGFAMSDAVLTAVESRSSSPVRILRDESFQSVSIKGIYPCGEGAGYAGGIMSAAIDGIKIAEAIAASDD